PRLVWRVRLPEFRTVAKSTPVRLVSSQRPLGDDRVDRGQGGRMETVVERPAALDVHKEQVTACVRVPGQGRSREQRVAEFPTTVAGLLTLRDWLAAFGVEQVVMEATGVYWKPMWAILEDESECLLVNARHVKQGWAILRFTGSSQLGEVIRSRQGSSN